MSQKPNGLFFLNKKVKMRNKNTWRTKKKNTFLQKGLEQ